MKKRKVVIVGTGMVGMSYAYAMLHNSFIDELVLIDKDKEKARGESVDISHAIPFTGKNIDVYCGEYSDCVDANLIVITAGSIQGKEDTRLDLAENNSAIVKDVVKNIMNSGFNGIILVATNPVDIMTKVAYETSGLSKNKVIGSGTVLDTARLKCEMSKYFNINTRHIHSYIIGEHGDSELAVWSKSYIGMNSVYEVLKNEPKYSMNELYNIYDRVKKSAYEIIKDKGATYYGIGAALTRISRAIFEDENSILTITTMLDGEYGYKNVFIGVPAIVNSSGAKKVQRLDLSECEKEKLKSSVTTVTDVYNSLK